MKILLEIIVLVLGALLLIYALEFLIEGFYVPAVICFAAGGMAAYLSINSIKE